MSLDCFRGKFLSVTRKHSEYEPDKKKSTVHLTAAIITQLM